MKAAIVTQPNQTPSYGDFEDPADQDGCELITVWQSSHYFLTKARAAGSLQLPGMFPMVVGFIGVGTTHSGQRVFSACPRLPSAAWPRRR